MDLNLAGRVAVVGGSSRGIGRAIAQTLFDEGASVCLTGRDAAALEAAAREMSDSSRVLAICGDLGNRGHVEDVFVQCLSRWGHVDILVANVGIGSGSAGWEIPDTEWQGLFQMNFWTSIGMAEAAIPHLKATGAGSILFVGSITGVEATAAPLPYSASKAALLNYAKNLSRELAPSGIRVNTIAPGNVLFAGGRWESRLNAQPEAVMEDIRTEVPMSRFGTPEEIAVVAAFLCSNRASFVTGACLVADGGQTRSL